jgi:hypothetical protein
MKISEFIVEDTTTEYIIYVDDKPATKYATKSEADRDLEAIKHKYPQKNIVIKRRITKSKEDIAENSDQPSRYPPHNAVGVANWREIKRAYEFRGPKEDTLHDARLNFDGVRVPLTKSSGDLKRSYAWCKNHLGNNEHYAVFNKLGSPQQLNTLVISMRPRQKMGEDASTTPGGVGGGTKMFLEDDDGPQVREYEDSYGRKRWEVLDWRGHRVHSFDSKKLAHDYLKKNRYDLTEPVDETYSGPKMKFLRPGELRGSYTDAQLSALGFKKSSKGVWYTTQQKFDQLVQSGQLK